MKRILTEDDVFYDDDPQSAGTGTWYDFMSPGLLTGGDGGPEIVAHFMSVTPYCFFKGAEDGRKSDEFIGIIEQIGGSVGRDISSLPPGAQAAAVAAWFKKTRPPKNMTPYIAEVTLEIERRAASSPAERFEPILAGNWREYKPLSILWPQEVDEVLTTIGALANSLGISGLANGITPQIMDSLVTTLHDIISYAVSPTNAERTTEVVNAHRNASRDSADKELSTQAKHQLQADTKFQLLKTTIEAIPIGDHVATAKAMLEADHGAGMLFLNGKINHDNWMKERGGARTPSAIQRTSTPLRGR